jgi:hypothetical protein
MRFQLFLFLEFNLKCAASELQEMGFLLIFGIQFDEGNKSHIYKIWERS